MGGYYEKVQATCKCGNVANMLKYSYIQNCKRNGSFVCMSCAKNKKWEPNLEENQKAIIIGSLLGDATIRIGPTKQW